MAEYKVLKDPVSNAEDRDHYLLPIALEPNTRQLCLGLLYSAREQTLDLPLDRQEYLQCGIALLQGKACPRTAALQCSAWIAESSERSYGHEQFPTNQKKGCSSLRLAGQSWLTFCLWLDNATSSYFPSFTKHHWVARVTFSTVKRCDASLQSVCHHKYSYFFIKDSHRQERNNPPLVGQNNTAFLFLFVISDSFLFKIMLSSRKSWIPPI